MVDFLISLHVYQVDVSAKKNGKQYLIEKNNNKSLRVLSSHQLQAATNGLLETYSWNEHNANNIGPPSIF